MGLRFCGVDLACADLERADAPYSILELNDAPSLSNYVTLGEQQQQQVRALYRKMFSQEHM
jgi:hypothetical protein